MTGQNRKAGTRNRNTREIPVHDAHIMEIRANRWIEDISFVDQFSSSWRSFVWGYNGVRWIEFLFFVVDRTNINITEICTGRDLTTVIDDAPKPHPLPRIGNVKRYLIRQRPHFIADFLIRSIIRTRLFNDYLGSLTNTPVVCECQRIFEPSGNQYLSH